MAHRRVRESCCEPHHPALANAGQALPLASPLAVTTDLTALPPVAQPPSLAVAAVADATDGATLALANGGGTCALAASTAFVKGLESTVPLFLLWLALTTFFYFLRRRRAAA